MPVVDNYPVLPEQIIRTSEQLFSECVDIASAGNPKPAVDWAWVWSNGTKRDDVVGSYVP